MRAATAGRWSVGRWRRLRSADPVLDRACALVMVRSGCTERQALESLSRIARATHRTLLEVAVDIERQDQEAAARVPAAVTVRDADVVTLRAPRTSHRRRSDVGTL